MSPHDELLAAASAGDLATIHLALQNGESPDAASSTGSTLLMRASHGGFESIVKVLLQARADASLRDSTYGTSALMLASASGHVTCLDLLLSQAADVSKQDMEGRSALLYAARRGHSTCVARLLAAWSANAVGHGDPSLVDMADETGLTALMGSAQSNNVDCMRELLSAGATLEARDHLGMTALHAACRAGSLEACNELLRIGARVDVVDDDGLDPFDHCDPTSANYDDLCAILHSAHTLQSVLGAPTVEVLNARHSSLGAVDLPGEDVEDDQWDGCSFKSYDSQQDDRPWH